MLRSLSRLMVVLLLGSLTAGFAGRRLEAQAAPDRLAQDGSEIARRKKKKKKQRTAPLVLEGSLTVVQPSPNGPGGQRTVSWKGHLERIGGELSGPVALKYGPGTRTMTVTGKGSWNNEETMGEWQEQKGAKPSQYIAPDQVSLALSGKTSGSTAQLSVTSWISYSSWELHKRDGRIDRRSDTRQLHWPAWEGPKVPIQVLSNGRMIVAFKNVRYVDPHTGWVFQVNGRFEGKGGWDLEADEEVKGLESGAASFEVEARDVPAGGTVRWSGDLGQQSGGGNSIRVRYTRPGIYNVTATYKPKRRARETRTVILYVVEVKFKTVGPAAEPDDRGRLIRDETHPDLPSSVPPGKFRKLNVEVTPDLTGSEHAIGLDVIGTTGGVSGGGRVEPAQVQKSRELLVYGVEQTESGRGPELQVRARLEGQKTEWVSAPFAVCAHPNAIEFTFLYVQQGGNDGGAGVSGDHYGPVYELKPRRGSHSDSDYWWDQDEVELKELIKPVVGTLLWDGLPEEVGPWVPAMRTDPPIRDRHTLAADSVFNLMAKLREVADRNNGNLGGQVADQLILFRCKRCGAGAPDGLPVTRAGFRIRKDALRTRAGLTPQFKLTVQKIPFRVGGSEPGIIQEGKTGPFPVTIP